MGIGMKWSEVKWIEVKWSDVTWREDLWWNVCMITDLQLCSLYVGYCTVSLVVSLPPPYLLDVFFPYHVLIICFMFLIYLFYVCFLRVFCVLFFAFYVFVLFRVLSPSVYIPYILESNPHPFYGFRGLKNHMRIRIACGLDSQSWARFWKNDRAAVRAVRTIQYNNLLFYLLFIILYII